MRTCWSPTSTHRSAWSRTDVHAGSQHRLSASSQTSPMISGWSCRSWSRWVAGRSRRRWIATAVVSAVPGGCDCRSSQWVTDPSRWNARPLRPNMKPRSKAASEVPQPKREPHPGKDDSPTPPSPLLIVRRLPASPRCRQPQHQQAADDDADHHDRAEGTPGVVVFAVFNEQRNHEYNPTDRSAIRGSSSGRFLDETESVFEGDIDKLAIAEVALGFDPPENDQFCPTSNVTRGQMAAFLCYMAVSMSLGS